MRNRSMLEGVFAPIITPFDSNENILLSKLAFNIEKYNQTSLKGYMPLGSNGEYQGLTDEESFLILETVYKCKGKDKVIVAGCGRESAFKTIDFIKKAADYGLDIAFILPPHYFVNYMSKEALLDYYIHVAGNSPIPVILYNAPKFASNLLISADLVRELSSHPNIIAMKNSSLEPNTHYIKAIPADSEFCLIAGNIKTFFPGLIDGVAGGVLSTASFLPDYCCEMYNHFREGNLEKAEILHEFLNALSSQSVGRYGVAGVKYGMELRGFYGGRPRIPLQALSCAEKNQIISAFERFGIKPL